MICILGSLFQKAKKDRKQMFKKLCGKYINYVVLQIAISKYRKMKNQIRK